MIQSDEEAKITLMMRNNHNAVLLHEPTPQINFSKSIGKSTNGPLGKNKASAKLNVVPLNVSSTKLPRVQMYNRYRIQFNEEGKCVGFTNQNDLVVSFCDPTNEHSFLYSNGILQSLSVEDYLCVGLKNLSSNHLALVRCSQAIQLSFVDNQLVHKDEHTGKRTCLSPMKGKKSTPSPPIGASVAQTKCHVKSSAINLLEETVFRRERKALLMSYRGDNPCLSPALGANNRPPMAKLLPENEVDKCKKLSECLTVVVKTARRPDLVVRLAGSIRNVLGEDLPIIVIDDGPMSHPPEIMDKIKQFPNIKYVVVEEPDLGISEGRNRGVAMVQTKYLATMDDDNVVTDSWNVAQMVEVLDISDLSLVGSRTDSFSWPGFMEFGCLNNNSILRQYTGSCLSANQTLPFFPECLRCDLTSNSFVARTKVIVEVGGWSREIKVHEHEDIFLRLLAAGKKVVWCPNSHVLNVHTHNNKSTIDTDYKKKRYMRGKRMKQIFFNHWNIAIHQHVKKKDWSFTWTNDV